MDRGWLTRERGSSRPARGVLRERSIDCLVARSRAGRCVQRLRIGMQPERCPRLIERAAAE
jgi:hypothetical protein